MAYQSYINQYSFEFTGFKGASNVHFTLSFSNETNTTCMIRAMLKPNAQNQIKKLTEIGFEDNGSFPKAYFKDVKEAYEFIFEKLTPEAQEKFEYDLITYTIMRKKLTKVPEHLIRKLKMSNPNILKQIEALEALYKD